MLNKFSFTIKGIIKYVFIFLLILMLFNSLENIKETEYNLFLFKFLRSILYLIGFTLFSHLFMKINISSKKFLLFLFCVSFVVKLIFILNVEIKPISDFVLILNTAKEINAGNVNSVLESAYFQLWTYNIPITVLESYLLTINDSILFIQLINIIVASGIVCLVYCITFEIFGKKSAEFSSLIALVFPPLTIFSGILTNQHISIFFLLFGFYYFVKGKNYFYVGLFIAIGHIFRPIGTLIILAILFITVFKIIENRNYNKTVLKQSFVNIVKLIVSYNIVIALVSFFLIQKGFTNKTLFTDLAPNYKLLVGLNHDSKGQYSRSDAELLSDTYQTDFNEKSTVLIQDRLANKKRLLQLFEYKFKTMWSSDDSSFFWSKWHNNLAKSFTDYMWFFIIFFSVIAIVKSKISNISNNLLIVLVIITLFIFVYFLIEIQTRYRYEVYPFFFIISGFGLLKFHEIIRNIWITKRGL